MADYDNIKNALIVYGISSEVVGNINELTVEQGDRLLKFVTLNPLAATDEAVLCLINYAKDNNVIVMQQIVLMINYGISVSEATAVCNTCIDDGKRGVDICASVSKFIRDRKRDKSLEDESIQRIDAMCNHFLNLSGEITRQNDALNRQGAQLELVNETIKNRNEEVEALNNKNKMLQDANDRLSGLVTDSNDKYRMLGIELENSTVEFERKEKEYQDKISKLQDELTKSNALYEEYQDYCIDHITHQLTTAENNDSSMVVAATKMAKNPGFLKGLLAGMSGNHEPTFEPKYNMEIIKACKERHYSCSAQILEAFKGGVVSYKEILKYIQLSSDENDLLEIINAYRN